MPLADAQQAVLSGDADIIDAITSTEERLKLFDFPEPHLQTDVLLYFDESIAGIMDASTAKGFLIGVAEGDACGVKLAKAGADNQKKYPTHEALVRAAVNNEVHVFCAQQPVGNYFLGQMGADERFRHTPPLYSPQGYWAVRKGNHKLLKEVEAGFKKISAVEQEQIFNKWYGAKVEQPYRPYVRYAAYSALVLLLMTAALGLWNQALRRRVEIKTADLESTLGHLQATQSALEEKHSVLKGILKETISSLATAMQHRDLSTAGHERRVRNLAVAIGKEMGWDDDRLEGLGLAATVHDIGQIQVPAEVLMRPRRLSREEFDLVKMHAEAGHEILKDISFPWPIAEIVYQHHENLDGSGYPRGLMGSQILPEAKIIRVADSVEAMLSHRPFRRSVGVELALERLNNGKGTLYDAEVVDICTRLLEKNGTGSLG